MGVAIAGAIFTNSLTQNLGSENANMILTNPDSIHKISNNEDLIRGIAKSLGTVYYYTLPLSVLIFICNFWIEEYIPDKKKDDDATVVDLEP